MRAPRFPAISFSPSPFAVSSTAVRGRHCFPPSTVRSRHLGFDEGGSSKYWDKFYKRHQNKFFKDRHYLEKDWGKYFSDDSSASPNGKVVLEVGCGAGNTVFPLVAKHPKLFVHACDFSTHAIAIVKSHVDFNEDRVNAFLCDVVNDDLCDTMMPSSIDVVTLIFVLSAVCLKKMHLILQNLKKVLKPDGHILLRDYVIGDYAQGCVHISNLYLFCGLVADLVAKHPKLFVHACDFWPHAIAIVKSHVDFNEDRVNAFLCDVVNDDLCDTMMPSSIDVVTLIFVLSAVCPKRMHLILQNLKKVLKPDGHILLRN